MDDNERMYAEALQGFMEDSLKKVDKMFKDKNTAEAVKRELLTGLKHTVDRKLEEL